MYIYILYSERRVLCSSGNLKETSTRYTMARIIYVSYFCCVVLFANATFTWREYEGPDCEDVNPTTYEMKVHDWRPRGENTDNCEATDFFRPMTFGHVNCNDVFRNGTIHALFHMSTCPPPDCSETCEFPTNLSYGFQRYYTLRFLGMLPGVCSPHPFAENRSVIYKCFTESKHFQPNQGNSIGTTRMTSCVGVGFTWLALYSLDSVM
jgi:hypothetical protein